MVLGWWRFRPAEHPSWDVTTIGAGAIVPDATAAARSFLLTAIVIVVMKSAAEGGQSTPFRPIVERMPSDQLLHPALFGSARDSYRCYESRSVVERPSKARSPTGRPDERRGGGGQRLRSALLALPSDLARGRSCLRRDLESKQASHVDAWRRFIRSRLSSLLDHVLLVGAVRFAGVTVT